jgi:RNA polymerase sigma factor (sigma-70 family)
MNENELIQKYYGLVLNIVNTFNPRNEFERADFIQEGCIALLRAIRQHDAKRGKISTLAWKYITNALIGYKRKTYEHEVSNSFEEPTFEYINQLWEIIPNNLSEIEKIIVYMRYKGYTFQEIGKEIKYTKSWVSQIFKKAVSKIQKANE